MIITVQLESEVPLYQQIRDQVVAGIAAGSLAVGEQLPSVRALGSELGINLHTVNKAYALLQQEGYVTIQGRKGAHVLDVRGEGSTARQERAHQALFQALAGAAREARIWGRTEEDFIADARKAYEHAEKGMGKK